MYPLPSLQGCGKEGDESEFISGKRRDLCQQLNSQAMFVALSLRGVETEKFLLDDHREIAVFLVPSRISVSYTALKTSDVMYNIHIHIAYDITMMSYAV